MLNNDEKIRHKLFNLVLSSPCSSKYSSGADPGFQVKGGALKKMRGAEGGAKIVGVFRVKNHDFTPKKNHIFTNFRGGRARVRPSPLPLNPPL
jgi:hypothetical protein